MKYRIQVLVDNDRLPAVIEAAFAGALEYDPELKVWPAFAPREAPTPKNYSQVGGVHRETLLVQGAMRPGGRRHELVEAALKTGPKRWGELGAVLIAGGLAKSSLNSVISRMRKEGKIVQNDEGLWGLAG
jgi:hypothetical protein